MSNALFTALEETTGLNLDQETISKLESTLEQKFQLKFNKEGVLKVANALGIDGDKSLKVAVAIKSAAAASLKIKSTKKQFRNAAARGDFSTPHEESDNEHAIIEIPDSERAIMGVRKVTTLVKIDNVNHKAIAADYPMDWKDIRVEGKPGTTHELAFDMWNGFDEGYVYVSGMTKNCVARVSKADPTKQLVFHFGTPPSHSNVNPGTAENAQPHTLIFANTKSHDEKGMLWVGLENWGLIVKLNMSVLVKKNQPEGKIEITEEDYVEVYDVRVYGAGRTIPLPINTRPHGFCFDAEFKYIYFTGKLTNTVGRIKISGSPEEMENYHKESVEHFEIPTLGSVPIYVSLGPDKNIWGTSLRSSTIFQVNTQVEKPYVTEIAIHPNGEDRTPIAIVPDPRKGSRFMWFSSEAGHSVCRLDAVKYNEQYRSTQQMKDSGNCICSTGCKKRFKNDALELRKGVITEFPVPKMNHHMKLGGLAVSSKGEVWTQSYVDKSENDEGLPDYIIKLEFNNHDPTNTHDKDRDMSEGFIAVGMTGLPIGFYELPTKNTILHRIKLDPTDNVWFTELGADRIGMIRVDGPKIEKEGITKKRKISNI